MVIIDMVVHIVPGCKCLITKFARIRKGARKMNIFYMFSQVTLVFSIFSTYGTREYSVLILVNVLIKEPWPWNRYSDLGSHSSVHVRNMHVQQVPGCMLLTTVLAFVNERPWKVNVLYMFAKISSIFATFSTK